MICVPTWPGRRDGWCRGARAGWSYEMRDLTTADLDWVDESITSVDTASLVDRHSTFDGNFRSQRDLRVDGELKGNVACDGTLFVSEGRRLPPQLKPST